MKKILTILCVFLSWAGIANAQTGDRRVSATDVVITHKGNDVTVSFALIAGKRATKATYNLVVTPVLKNGGYEKQLPSVVIRGKRSKVIDLRHELMGGTRPDEQIIAPGSSFDYTATVPFQEWMTGGRLTLEGVSVGCCSSTETALGLVADNVLRGEPTIDMRLVEVPVIVPNTTGEQMAGQYQFVSLADNFPLLDEVMRNPGDPTILDRVINETRQGSVSVYFGQGLRIIDRDFAGNNDNLVELIAAVRSLSSASDAKIAAIIIAGFASPEGAVPYNEKLAYDRAVAVKDFLVNNTDVSPSVVRIFNGGADWTGLREWVKESSMPQKQQIIDIIENTPVWDSQRNLGRLGELMRLDGGEPYRYMLEHLFPELRQAAYIKVYFQNR